MIKPEKFRNDSHHNKGIHMFAILFGISPEKQIKKTDFTMNLHLCIRITHQVVL